MSGEPERTLLDELVEKLAALMDSLGFNGTRLRWKWNRRNQSIGEAKAQGEQWVRSVKAKHKMCPECRALVDRDLNRCPECGESLDRASRPGMGRALGNLVPGVKSVTPLLLLVNGFWFVLMLMAQIKNGSNAGLFSMDPLVLVQFGMGVNRPMPMPDQSITGGEWWRFVTPMFLHGGLLHFGFNSMVLMQLGQIAESIYGSARFWVLYFVCGVMGSIFSMRLRIPMPQDVPVMTVGASGALLGILGLLVVHSIRRTSVLGDLKRTLFQFGIYMLILSFVFQNMDHWAHGGGFLTGLVLGLIVPPESDARQPVPERAWQVLGFSAVIVVVVAFYSVATVSR